MEAAISACVADEYNRVSSQKLPEGGETAHAVVVREGKGKEPGAWKPLKVFKSLKVGEVGQPAIDSR